MNEIKHICILRLSALGDVSNCLPSLRAIQAKYPQAHITWIIGKNEFALVRDLPKIKWAIVDKKRLIKSWQQLSKLNKFDVILHMQASLRASFLRTALRSTKTIGLDKERSKDFQGIFCNARISPREEAHTLETYLDFAKAIGADIAKPYWGLRVSLMHDETKDMDLPIEYVAISPCSSKKIRNWTVQGYAKIIKYIDKKYNLACVLVGGPGSIEQEYATKITDLAPKTTNLVGKTNIRQMVSIIADARFLIAPDSGPAHIGSAVGTKVLGLYANTNPKRARSYLYPEYVVDLYPQAVKQYLKKEVSAVKFGTRVRAPAVMSLIKASAVKQMVDKIMQEALR